MTAESAQAQAIANDESDANPPSAAGTSIEPGAATPLSAQAPEQVTPTSSLAGSARELVNADGSLVKPQRRGPLAGLREKLGG